ncbi:MAG TPA: glycosyltransferase family 2 protein [Candidatus Sulfopaludibacter sp.]|jgi:GT2 family glycosyltransferase|nr:glycosyltransferase family 2 protein [Candidatus Sulfopaludibacter sp.]
MKKVAPLTISVVISNRNGGPAFLSCLAALTRYRDQFQEFIVVDDASTDDSIKAAEAAGARVLTVPVRKGPANGRNLGARAATGDILLFLDADVCVHADTITRILERFQSDPELCGVFGSYDTDPAVRGLVSEYRNLLHSFIHHTSKHSATTFWSGCGAILKEVFLASGGFDVSYSVPCVEDIELGMRLVREGRHIVLDPFIQVQHLKCWTLRNMIETDIKHRGIPWGRLILASHRMPNDLNLRWSSRLSVIFLLVLCLGALVFTAGLMNSGLAQLLWPGMLAGLAAFTSIAAINMPFYRFLAARRSFKFATASMLLHLIYLFCCGTAMGMAIGIHCWSLAAARVNRVAVASASQRGE